MDQEVQAALARPSVGVASAAKLLGVSRNAAYRAIHGGSLPAVRVGGQFRVPTAKLREMLGLPQAESVAA